MSEKNIKTRIVHKHDTEAKWLTKSFIPLQGEIIIYDIDASHNYERFKIGDGKTQVSALPFVDDVAKAQINTLNTTIQSVDTKLTDLVGDTAVATQISDAMDETITGLSVSGKTITYTKGDGSTGTITTQDTNTTYSTATSSTAGLVKIGYTESGKNYPVELNGSGQMYVNVPWTDNNTTYSAMTGATSSAAGAAGLVPAPAAGKQAQYLRGDGTWATPTNTTYSVATTSANGLMSSTDKSKLDGIASGANKTTVDSALSSTSTNPVQNKVVNSAISNLNTLVGDTAVSIQISEAIASKSDTGHTHNYAGSSTAGGAANSVKTNLIVKLNGGSTEGTNLFTYNGSTAKTINVTPSAIGAAASSHGTHVTFATATPKAAGTAAVGTATTVSRSDHVHPAQTSITGNAATATKATQDASGNVITSTYATKTELNAVSTLVGDTEVSTQITNAIASKADSIHTHNYAGSSSAGGAANSVKANMVVKLNGGSTEGTNLFTYNGSTAKTVNITPSAIGAAASSHGNHVPATETANNAKFLRNDNTWQTVTPANIGAAASSHGTHVTYSTTAPVMDGTASAGSAATVARSDHKHPTDTSRAAASSLTALQNLVGDKSVQTQIADAITSKSDVGHTHDYAGSSSAGGAATSANKLNTDAGSATNPVYFANGVPVKTTYTLGKSVPSDAVFTDTTYSQGTGISISGTTISNSGVRSVATGSTNGTISVNTNGTSANVAVKGLGSAAYTASTAYDAAGAANTALTSAKAYTDSEMSRLVGDNPVQTQIESATHSASKITGGTFGGVVYAQSSTQDPATYLLRNSRLSSEELDPTQNGQICWMYE